MPTERLVIEISEKGARVVKRNIEDIGQGASTAGRAISQLKGALAVVATGAILRQLQQLADSFTNIQNRLRLVTTDQSNLNAVFKELQDISTRTRSSLEANAELYSRVAVSAKELGVSQAELLQFTERLNKAIKISGATVTEAAAGLTQLSQAMASGQLRGDELRSILEQLPAVADVIAKSMGVTRGELRALGEQGKITSQDILKAFREIGPELDAKFGKTVPTIAEGFQLLSNQLISTVGAIDQASGASSLLGQGMVAVTEFLKDLTPELVRFAHAITGTLDPMDELTDEGKVFATIFVTIYGVLKTLVRFIGGVVINAFKVVGSTIGGLVAAITTALSGDFARAGEILKDTFKNNGEIIADSSEKIKDNLVNDATETVTKLTQIWDKGARVIQDRQKEAIGKVSTTAGPAAKIGPTPQELQQMERLRNQLIQVLNTINPIPGATLEMAKAREILTQAQAKGLLTQKELTEDLFLLGERYKDILDPLGKLNREMDEQIGLLHMTADAREVEGHILEIRKALLDQGVRLTKEETDAIRAKLEAMQQLSKVVAAQDQLLADSVEKRKEFRTQLEAIQNLLADPASGFGTGDAATATTGLISALGLDPTGFQTQIDATLSQTQEMYKRIDELRQANLISEQEAAALRVQVWQKSQESMLSTAGTFFGDLAQLQKSENSKIAKIGKAAAIAEAIINTYKAATAAYASLAGIPYIGPALGAAAAGAAIVAGMANVNAIRSQPVGFAKGGYTGDTAVDQVAGVVHGKEFVMNAAATRNIGRPTLEAMQAQGAKGGWSGSQVKVVVENHGTPQVYETASVTPEEIRLIARDEATRQARKLTPDIVAGQLSRPNSRISQSLANNTETARRR